MSITHCLIGSIAKLNKNHFYHAVIQYCISLFILDRKNNDRICVVEFPINKMYIAADVICMQIAVSTWI